MTTIGKYDLMAVSFYDIYIEQEMCPKISK